MLSTLVAAVTLCVTALLACYLWRIPEGPACPRCGAATFRAEEGWPGMLLERWTQRRRCPVCAWCGRLRRGPEPGTAPRRERPGGAP